MLQQNIHVKPASCFSAVFPVKREPEKFIGTILPEELSFPLPVIHS